MSNHWIETYTHKKFDYEAFTQDDFCIEDIAHALSNMARFAGHTMKFYSVAQHSVLVSELMEITTKDENKDLIALYGLLHDASEAYLVDLPTPLKVMLPDYLKLEEAVQRNIYAKYLNKYQIKWEGHQPLLKEKDIVLALIEADMLLNRQIDWPLLSYNHLLKPNEVMYVQCWLENPLSPKEAEQAFLTRFIELQE